MSQAMGVMSDRQSERWCLGRKDPQRGDGFEEAQPARGGCRGPCGVDDAGQTARDRTPTP
jgi:hypothetical protein